MGETPHSGLRTPVFFAGRSVRSSITRTVSSLKPRNDPVRHRLNLPRGVGRGTRSGSTPVCDSTTAVSRLSEAYCRVTVPVSPHDLLCRFPPVSRTLTDCQPGTGAHADSKCASPPVRSWRSGIGVCTRITNAEGVAQRPFRSGGLPLPHGKGSPHTGGMGLLRARERAKTRPSDSVCLGGRTNGGPGGLCLRAPRGRSSGNPSA